MSWLLAHQWRRLGEHVTVVSDVTCGAEDRGPLPFSVHYRPSFGCWLKVMREADVLVHMNISLKALWPLALVRRPFVAVHHGFYTTDRMGRQDWRERLKLKVMSHATNIAVSEAVAEQLPVPCHAIPNPIDVSLFENNLGTRRERELVFVGRLVSDKGCDLLLRALALLREAGLRPKLTVIGVGPERLALEQLAAALELTDQVCFAGPQPQKEVSRFLQQHQILVVPSLWEEPFGLVALEGAACGCVVLGSDGGGLPEAIGPTGTLFRRGNLRDLTDKLSSLLRNPTEWCRYHKAAKAHLGRHQPQSVARSYLEVFQQAKDETRRSRNAPQKQHAPPRKTLTLLRSIVSPPSDRN